MVLFCRWWWAVNEQRKCHWSQNIQKKTQYIINLDFKTADTIILTIQMIIILNTFGVAILLKKKPNLLCLSNKQPAAPSCQPTWIWKKRKCTCLLYPVIKNKRPPRQAMYIFVVTPLLLKSFQASLQRWRVFPVWPSFYQLFLNVNQYSCYSGPDICGAPLGTQRNNCCPDQIYNYVLCPPSNWEM